ncbi:MAG: phosphotransferase enzyme family protein [Pseudonocardiaceae bacterium]
MTPANEEQQLTGGFITSSVTRRGDTVRRTPGPWSPAVHTWLAHLAAYGETLAPHPLGLDEAHRVEVLSYLDGTVPSGGASPPYLWREETLSTVARLIRRFHDASVDFTPPAEARWQPTGAYPDGGEVMCHNDLAPWNTVFIDEHPVGFIDWDLAAPGPRLWDVAFALWHFVPLYGDPSSDPFDVTVFEPRARRTRLFCDAYGLADRGRVVDMVIERQLATRAAIERGANAGEPAYQRLWELGAGDGIRRQIHYAQAHHHELEQALV